MKRRYLCFLWTTLILRVDIFIAAEVDPAVLNPDLSHFQQVSNTEVYSVHFIVIIKLKLKLEKYICNII